MNRITKFVSLAAILTLPFSPRAVEAADNAPSRARADAHYDAVELEEAAALYLELSKASPADVNLRIRLAECLTRTDRFEEAIDQARQAVSLAEREPGALAALGLALYRRGSFKESEERLREGIEVDPECARCRWGLGRLLEIRGDGPGAAEHFRTAAAAEPDNPIFLRHLAPYVADRKARMEIYRQYLDLPRREEERVWENVRAWLAVLKALGDRPLNQVTLPEEGTEVRLESRGGLNYISVDVGSRKKRRYLFDTGASGFTISKGLMKRLKLKPVATSTITGIGGQGMAETEMVIVDQIRVGDATVRNVPAVVSDAIPLVDGLLGPTLFGGAVIHIDPEARRLGIGRADPAAGNAGGQGANESGECRRTKRSASVTREVPFLNINGTPFVIISVDGVSMNAMVDSGGSQAVLSRFAAEQIAGLELMSPGLIGAGVPEIRGATGDWEEVQVVRKARLEFAGNELKMAALNTDRERFLFQKDLTPLSHALGTEVWAILGNPQLDDFIMTIDFERQVLRLTDLH